MGDKALYALENEMIWMNQNYIATLDQALNFLSTINQDTYVQQPSNKMSPIGAHIRHILDHFNAIINGTTRGRIDYEERNRGSLVEFNLTIAMARFNEIKQWFSQLKSQDYLQAVTIESDIGLDGVEIMTAPSSLNRELMFACTHAIHHYSILKIILKDINSQECDSQFGKAASTANFEQQKEAVQNDALQNTTVITADIQQVQPKA